MSLTRRQRVLAGLFVAAGVLTLAILAQVIETVFFAVTVAYVLYPVRRELVKRGVSRWLAASISTVLGFLAVVVLVTPLFVALYVRRQDLLSFMRSIPASLPVTVLGETYVIDVSRSLVQARSAVVSVAVDLAAAAPVIALKLFLFVIVVYALLRRPSRIRDSLDRLVPAEYHDVAIALHERVRDTLYALYVLQAATALGTFVVAYAAFSLLGYDVAFTLAILSGVLQFIPILGPSVLVAALAAFEAMSGDVTGAIVVTVVGLLFVGFLPDAVIRPRLASVTTELSASLYFIGFVGGTLTVGVVGVIAGPLIVALFVEVADLATAARNDRQSTLSDAAAASVPRAGTAETGDPASGSDPADGEN